MPYTQLQLDKIKHHLERYEPSACPICTSTDWTTLPYPGAIVAQQKPTVNIYKTLEVVQRMCDTCGYVVQFAASKIGVEQKARPTKRQRSSAR